MVSTTSGAPDCRAPREFYGLSKDEKPVGYIDGVKVTNGSIFLEMDTKKFFVFDEENQVWYEQ